MGVAGLNDGPDTGHLSEYGGRDDEDAAPREHDTAVLKNYLRQNFEKAKFEAGPNGRTKTKIENATTVP